MTIRLAMLSMAFLLSFSLISPVEAQGSRRQSGEGQPMRFSAGELVLAGYFTFDDGSYARGGCWTWAHTSGTLYSGVAWPSQQELARFPQCTIRPARIATGDGGEARFEAGQTALGFRLIFDNNGGTVFNCVIVNSARGGWVLSGVIDPWDEEIAQMRTCFG